MKNVIVKRLIKLICFILILILPFAVFFLVTELTENQYRNTFVAELEDKCARLNNTEGKRIIFVGGSSLPFGLRSDLIERELSGYSVVDFGLYATLGTKVMMDLSKMNINKGDIVVLSPELNAQTYSLYFNPVALEEALDGFSFKYRYLSVKDNLSLFYNYYKFALNKLEYSANNATPDPIGIYRHDSFNEYGDIAVERPNNIMNNGVDSTMDIYATDALLNKAFLDYVNDYCGFVRSKKAKIYFNFSPCNQLAIATSEAGRAKFQQKLQDEIECDLLSNLEDCIIDYRYFYDTNFHLNSAGAVYYTNLLINNLKLKLGLNVPMGGGDNPSIAVPDPPKPPDQEVVEPDDKDGLTPFEDYLGEPNNDYADWFEYRLAGQSYAIVGVKDEYKNMEEVILPSTHEGKNVTTIEADAFYGCINLKRIHIGLTYRTFEGYAFNGCIGLERIYLYETEGNKLSPSSDGLLKGEVGRNVKIYIPEGSNYATGYTWENYSGYFVYYDKGE